MRALFPLIALTVAVAASPAWALKVTNLDTVPHLILFTVAGKDIQRTVQPNETTRFDGMPNGRLSLLSSPTPNVGGTLNGTGVLSKYIGNGRDQGVPADQMDEYVIWKGGKMMLQRRMKPYGYGR